MSVDLSGNPTPMRTRDGRRADFVRVNGHDKAVYLVQFRPEQAYFPNGQIHSGDAEHDIDLIGPWWVVGETYLHDGKDECPLPKGAKCWRHYPNCIYLAAWANVVAYTITEMPPVKLSVADELRELIVNELGYTSSFRAKVAALADRLDKEGRGND